MSAITPARAQTDAGPAPEANGANQTNGDIVVTALRRTQRVQDVPAAISVLDAAAIQAKGAQDFRDYLTSLPGVNFSEAGNLGGMRVTIRGVSDGSSASDPLAGIYLDEAPITESFFGTLDPDVYDIDRVEVLRGPQGTLYGASSMGGTVRVITKKPKLDEIEGAVEGTIGDVAHGGWNRRIDGVVNVPILEDKLALRVSAGYRKDDGWIDDVQLGRKNVNDIEKKNLRGQLRYQPGPDTSITLGVLWQKEDLGAQPQDDVALPDYQTRRYYQAYTKSDAKLFSLTLQQDFDTVSLISATNYLDKSLQLGSDNTAQFRALLPRLIGVGPTGNDGLGSISDNEFKLFTQEVRVASVGSNRVDYVLGGFYSDATTDLLQTYDFTKAPQVQARTNGLAFYTYDQEYRTRQIAGFGQLTFNATEKFALTAGLRVFNVEQTTTTFASGILNGGATSSIQKSKTTQAQQKYLAEYKVTKDNLVYAQAAQGYRNGAPTGNGLRSACAAELASLGYSTFPTSYGPDKLWNYEIGSKNTLFDRKMTLNAAAYYTDWSDIQTSITLSCNSGFVSNAGKARIKGLEVESSVEPLDGLTLTGSVSYTDAKLKEPAPGARGVSAGDPLPQVAKWSWNASAQYRRPVAEGVNAFVRGEVNHVGSRWNLYRSAGASAVLMDPYTLVSARLGVGSENWSAAVFATNLFDERYVLNRVAGAVPFELVGRPRTIGVNARIGF
ncbi:outer membrane receptor protein involved in Fe transport [Novosphingobium chloroacetimidivorans]|uniref:Outer membrane receptor protein involved in Fe transport n=1 Tax=Novosphingobium chloroacetimidivorans TaxID=1428314 RepID=A0A7W7K9E8_9SPHN|nr:TonB-dependent receptor [Novosphingobium chloroacetimidivorans]MBB4857958.1 outer membrane receptor protein involved in Fe transport [Novosphingobium chloroacetimidivorans]